MRSLALLCLLIGCQAAPPPMPEGSGRGLVPGEAEPPAGATTWQRPTWRVGDRFVLVRGDRMRGEFVVAEATASHYAIDTGNDVMIRRDLDLGNLGEWDAAGTPRHVLSPADARYSWPLWVGKRWSSEYVDRAPGGAALRMRADYVVEDLDTITVPAGTFQALRITRRLSLLDTKDYLTRWQVTWYAPDVGTEVRQIVGDTLVELVEHQPAR